MKLCLTGWGAYKACVGDSSNGIICGISCLYFLILCLASCSRCKYLPKRQEIDTLEGMYLKELEEGLLDLERSGKRD